jgi:serine/threonine-protein kinase
MTSEQSTPDARYTHFEKVAEGGGSEVFKAWDNQLQRWVAIKRMMNTQGESDNSASLAGWHEAMRLASLSHPNIVTVYDFGEDEKGSYVVMEFLDGETLDAFIERTGVMHEMNFIELMKQVLEGVVAAHQKGLVHRDLKPGNVMLTWLPSGRFQAKVLDFGLSEFLKGTHTEATIASGSLLGSVYYMSPEQWQGGLIDARADLYALGCIGYFCLTRRNAFDGEDVDTVMQSHLEHRFIPLLQLRPDLSMGLASWVERLMSFAAEDRFSSAAMALKELLNLSAPSSAESSPKNGSTASADAGPMGARSSLPVLPKESNAGMKWAGGITVLVMLGALGFWFYVKNQPNVAHPAPSVPAVPSVAVNDIEKPTMATQTETRSNAQTESSNKTQTNEAERYAPDDLEGLRKKLGDRVTIEGRVVASGQNKAKTLYYINFDRNYNKAITLVVRVQKFLEADQEAVLNNMVGKRIRYTGKVSEFQGRLQIFVDDIENVILLD